MVENKNRKYLTYIIALKLILYGFLCSQLHGNLVDKY
jgi:hypothetical protein